MKKVLLLILVVSILSHCSNSKETVENSSGKSEAAWDVYLARYDEGVGSTTLNMDLIKVAPKKQLPFLVVTGVTFKNCTDDGLPNPEQLDTLYVISDEVVNAIANLTSSEHAGSFTYQCDKLDYIYVSDTLEIRSALVELYSSKHAGYEYYTRIERDEKWEAYTTFLYPSDDIQDHMSNAKVLEQLEASGDDLSKPRKIEHFMSFKDEQGRARFETFAIKNGFEIENRSKQEEGNFKYAVVISRIDSVDIESLSELTLLLRRRIERDGTYDGWESPVVKE